MEFKHRPSRTARFYASTNTIHAAGDWFHPVVCYLDGSEAYTMFNDGQHGELLPDDRQWACSAFYLIDGVYLVKDVNGSVEVEVRR